MRRRNVSTFTGSQSAKVHLDWRSPLDGGLPQTWRGVVSRFLPPSVFPQTGCLLVAIETEFSLWAVEAGKHQAGCQPCGEQIWREMICKTSRRPEKRKGKYRGSEDKREGLKKNWEEKKEAEGGDVLTNSTRGKLTEEPMSSREETILTARSHTFAWFHFIVSSGGIVVIRGLALFYQSVCLSAYLSVCLSSCRSLTCVLPATWQRWVSTTFTKSGHPK